MGEYLRGLRIAYACVDLTSTRKPLVEIALAAGFSSQSHFTRVFRQHLGTTPAAYRAAR